MVSFNRIGKYRVLRESIDFFGLPESVNKGTRAKKLVWVKGKNQKAIFKFDNGKKYRIGEDCSEKIACELAKVLNYPTAEIDLAESITGEMGLLSYLFIDKNKNESHEDIESYLDITKENEYCKYTIKNLESIFRRQFSDINFDDFLRIVFFDALVGERDRHVGNWGIVTRGNTRKISPLYDTANCLLVHFQNPKYMDTKTKTDADFAKFVNKNQLALYRDDIPEKYSPTSSIVDYLLIHHQKLTLSEINNLKKLKDDIIKNIINKIPDDRMKQKHKEYIIKYLKEQRDIFLQKGEQHGN